VCKYIDSYRKKGVGGEFISRCENCLSL